jgi:hypothetical protein
MFFFDFSASVTETPRVPSDASKRNNRKKAAAAACSEETTYKAGKRCYLYVKNYVERGQSINIR